MLFIILKEKICSEDYKHGLTGLINLKALDFSFIPEELFLLQELNAMEWMNTVKFFMD
jgi:hypothetical protein